MSSVKIDRMKQTIRSKESSRQTDGKDSKKGYHQKNHMTWIQHWNRMKTGSVTTGENWTPHELPGASGPMGKKNKLKRR